MGQGEGAYMVHQLVEDWLKGQGLFELLPVRLGGICKVSLLWERGGEEHERREVEGVSVIGILPPHTDTWP